MPIDKRVKIRELRDKIRDLENQRRELLDELDRSLAIEELWPGIFTEGCAVHTSVRGSASNGFRFVLTSGVGEEKFFPLKQRDLSCGDTYRVGIWSNEVPNILLERFCRQPGSFLVVCPENARR